MATLNAVILAAGEGTRMKSDQPKVLHRICGRPMVAYALDLVAMAGVKQPVVVLGHGAEDVKQALPKEVRTVIQTKQLGTGDAVLAAKKSLPSLSGDVLILYADTPLLRRTTIQRLIETHNKGNATCTLLTAHLADPSGYGRILRSETGQIAGIIEEADAHAPQRAIREINVGPVVVEAQALFDALAALRPSGATKELYLTEIVEHIAKQENTKILASKVEEVSEALGINSRFELSRAIGVIRQRIVEQHLANGVTIEDTQSTFIDQGVSIGRDTVIRPYTVIEAGVSIGKHCTIGPFARLRAGVSVGDRSKIGNFAELVRTSVGQDVRMGHVSYLGDAVVEEGVNIGAGTITANYDGKEKHQTHIGKHAFIGSDTVLIAPVKVGAHASTGAGCVVTAGHDVPAKSVVVGVPARAFNGKKADSAATNGKKVEKAEKSAAKPALPSARKGQAGKPQPRKAVKATLKPSRQARVAVRPPARRTGKAAKKAVRRPVRLPRGRGAANPASRRGSRKPARRLVAAGKARR